MEQLVAAVIERMNAGVPLEAIVHEVKVPAEVLALPFLRASYDEPEFVVRNIWRLYGGWWGGDVDRLKLMARGVFALASDESTSALTGASKWARRAVLDM